MADAAVTWVAADGIPPRMLMNLIFIPISLALAIVYVGFSLGETVGALEFRPEDGNLLGTAVVYFIGVLLPIVTVLGLLSQTEIRIGIGPSGLQLVSRVRRREVSWAQLRASTTTPSGKWGLVALRGTKRSNGGAFWVTRDQARAILSHPDAPSDLFPPEYWDWIGIPTPQTPPSLA